MATKVIVFVFLSIFILQMCCDNPERVPTSGPFRAVIDKFEECPSPNKPFLKDPAIIIKGFVHNSTSKVNMLNGNITVVKEIKNVKRRTRSFLWRNGKWELNFMLNNPNCHGLMVHLICVAITVKYDRKNCVYLKGSYFFRNLDVNQMLHYVTTRTEYGLQMWRIEEYVPAGTLVCIEIHLVIEPA